MDQITALTLLTPQVQGEIACFILDLIGQPAPSYTDATGGRQRSLANNSSAAALSLIRGNKAA